MTKRLLVLLLVLHLAPLLPVAAQQPLIWQQRTDVGSPGAYENGALAFHDRQGVMLLFGGLKYEFGGPLGLPSNDLWQYDGAAWQAVTVTGPRPAARSGHALVYDPVDQRVLLFGGDAGGSYLNDLWAFDFSGPAAGAWVRLADLPSAGRGGMAMGYDAGRDRFIVVGGIKQGTAEEFPVGGQMYGGVYPATRETWVWDRAAWSAGPTSARYNNGPVLDNFDFYIMAGPRDGALVHHAASGKTVLLSERYYGMTAIPVANVLYGAGGTSFYEGTNWTVNTGGNVYRENWSRFNVEWVSSYSRVVAAYDPARQRVVAFGAGRTNSQEFTGTLWAGATDETRGAFGPLPGGRARPCLGHDARRGVTVFFGGRASLNELGDTWELVENPAAPFVISTNLVTTPLELCQGETLALQGGASGVGPFTVRWFRDTVLLPGTNGFQLTLTNLLPAQAGAYTFEVTDSSGRKLRSQATPVVVHAPPQVSPPQVRRVVPGESFALEVSVTSTLPVTYQWYRGSDLLPGATGAVFTQASAAVADAGIYSVFVATRCTTVSSSGARVYVGPLINQHPAAPTNREVMAGPLTLTVTADGAGAQVGTYSVSGGTHPNHHAPDSPTHPLPMNFTWRHEGVPLVAGPNVLFSNTPLSSTLIIPQPDYEHEGAYDCVVADASGPAYAQVTTPAFVILGPLAPPYLTLLQGRGPEPRSYSGMVYDTRRQRTVLFGGEAYGVNPRSGSPNPGYFNSNDTWEWDGQSWIKRNPSTRPPALTQFGITYDSRRGRTVVFGGSKFPAPNYPLGSGVISNEIWEWDGSDWTQVVSANPPPPGRTSPMLCFDSVRGEVLMLGGALLNPQPPDYYGSRKILWAWDGAQWTQRGTIPGGGASDYVGGEQGFAFDAQRGVAVLFGSFSESNYPVWEWDGAVWKKVVPPVSLRVTESRQSGGAFYDPVRRRVGLPVISNNIFNSSGPSLPVVVWWDGREFLRGDTRTLDDLNGLVLTNGVESGPWGQVSDLVAFDAKRRCLVWQDMPQSISSGPAWTREMHFSAKVKPVHQPREVRFTAGQNLQLPSINAGQRPLVQQWLKAGVPLFDDAHWSGTATPRLGIVGATAADAGDYTLRVTGPYNQVTTDPIRLSLQGSGISLVVQGGLVLFWPGATGILETAPTAAGPWTALYGATSPYNVALDEAWRFYRVRYP